MQAPDFFVTVLQSCLLDPNTPSGANRIASSVGMFRKELYTRISLGLPSPFRRLFAIYITLSSCAAAGQLSSAEVGNLCHLLAHAHASLPAVQQGHGPLQHFPHTPSDNGKEHTGRLKNQDSSVVRQVGAARRFIAESYCALISVRASRGMTNGAGAWYFCAGVSNDRDTLICGERER